MSLRWSDWEIPDTNGIYVRVGQTCRPDRAGLKEPILHRVKMKYRVRQWINLEQATEGSPLHLVQAMNIGGQQILSATADLRLVQDDSSASDT